VTNGGFVKKHFFILGASLFAISVLSCNQPAASTGTTTGTTPGTTPVTATPTVTFTVNTTLERRAISPFIYGTNDASKVPGTNVRFGGNRWTGYNWENNASNAGSDYIHSSDTYLGGGSEPGGAVSSRITETFAKAQAALVTVPMVDYVAADTKGTVLETEVAPSARWKNNLIEKPGPLLGTPDLIDNNVYQDEFVAWLETKTAADRAAGKQVFYDLDNEPALWPGTHPRLHPAKPTYAEMIDRSVRTAKMIKTRAPNAKVFGAVTYGYGEMANLQSATDAAGRDYLDFFLAEMKKAETTAGKRLVDVLDLHWYSEARGDGIRVADDQNGVSGGVNDARMQAPRSFWDGTYKETSWIANDVLNAPINLIPRLQAQIAKHYPGTAIAFSEYNHGGENHISGAIAQADTLGIFGRYGVFQASFWPLTDKTAFIAGAMNMFLNYDAAGAKVGETSVNALNSDTTKTSIYAFAQSANDKSLQLIALNKTGSSITVRINITHPRAFSKGSLYTLMGSNPKPGAAQPISVAQGNDLTVTLEPYSVNTIALLE
jgi:Glycoside hydrolase family 44